MQLLALGRNPHPEGHGVYIKATRPSKVPLMKKTRAVIKKVPVTTK